MGLIFTYAVTAFGILVGPFRPFYGFLAYVCFSIIKPEALWYWSVPKSSFSWWIALSFLSGWIMHGLGTWPTQKSQIRAILCLIFYTIWAFIAALVSSDPDAGMLYVQNALKIVIPAIAGLTLVKTEKDLYLLAWTITASIGYLAFSLNESYFGGYNRLQEEGFGGFDNNSITIGLVTGVGLNFFLALYETNWIKKSILFVFSLVLVNAVLFSFSRGGMVGLILVGLTTIYIIPKTRLNIALVVAGIIVGFSITGPEVIARFMTIEQTSLTSQQPDNLESSAESRLHLWSICIDMIQDYPVFGVGPDQFIRRVGEYPVIAADGQIITYGAPGPKDQVTAFGAKEAHMLWLQVAAELGIIGSLSLLGYYVITYVASYRSIRRYNQLTSSFNKHIHMMVFTSLGSFVLSASFVSLEGLELPYYVAVLGMSANKISSTI